MLKASFNKTIQPINVRSSIWIYTFLYIANICSFGCYSWSVVVSKVKFFSCKILKIYVKINLALFPILCILCYSTNVEWNTLLETGKNRPHTNIGKRVRYIRHTQQIYSRLSVTTVYRQKIQQEKWRIQIWPCSLSTQFKRKILSSLLWNLVPPWSNL